MGAEPLPFEHTDFVTYQKNLETQAEQLELQVGSKKAEEARRTVARGLNRTSLSLAAGSLVPLQAFTRECTAPNDRLRRQCRSKFVHTNFLSALHHLQQLTQTHGELGLGIYHCVVCNGIHIGHPKKGTNQ